MPRTLHSGHDANPKQYYGHGHNVRLWNMHQVRKIGHTYDQNQVTNGVNSKGHDDLQVERVEAGSAVRCGIRRVRPDGKNTE
jgi:hypothetical protein